jgi:dihydroflavonol-4-reductase
MHSTYDSRADRASTNVLVTGGCGFIGRHLVSHLSARGARIRVLDVAEPAGLPGHIEYIQGSVLDRAALECAMAGVRHVYHLAGTPHLWVPDKAELPALNSVGTEMVLEVAAQQRVARVVHCSTEAILLPKVAAPSICVNEDASPEIDDMPGPYTRSKLLAEQAALRAAQGELSVVVVNPTVPIGPYDVNLTPPTAMLATFLIGGSPAFLDCVLNLVDVRDVAAGMVLAAERGRTGERYILGGENLSLRQLLELLEQVSGRPMPKHTLPAPLALATAAIAEWIADRVTGRPPVATREGVRLALRSVPFDSRKAQRELGYSPRPVRPALTEAVRWLSDHASSAHASKRFATARERLLQPRDFSAS